MKLAAIFALAALALAAGARAQSCPITASDLEGVSFEGVAEACAGLSGTLSATECDVCAGALLSAFADKLPDLGFSCDDVLALDSDALTSALTPCISVVIGPLQAAGVSTTSLLALRSCDAEPGENVRAAALEACPELADELD